MRAIFGLFLCMSLTVPSAAQVGASNSVTIVVPRFTSVLGAVSVSDSLDVVHSIDIHSNQMPQKVVYSGRSLAQTTSGQRLRPEVNNYLVARTPGIEAKILMGLGVGFSGTVTSRERLVVTVTD